MKSDGMEPRLLRLIDANLNRMREGIRVVEDIFRYVFDDKEIATKLKKIRHDVRSKIEKEALQHRDIKSDVLKGSIRSELQRSDLEELIQANLKRAQESARVLEETLKMIDLDESECFKKSRYELYDIEKSIFKKLFGSSI